MWKDSVQFKIVFKLMKRDAQNVYKTMKLIKMVFVRLMILTVLQETFIPNVLVVMMDIMSIQLQDVAHLL